jgi:hypothetical protein
VLMTARSIELVSVQALGLRLDREAIVCTARVREDSHVLLAAMQKVSETDSLDSKFSVLRYP